MVFRQADLTPCGVLFDVFKRKGGINHKELAGLILSDRPLSDGRSASIVHGSRISLFTRR